MLGFLSFIGGWYDFNEGEQKQIKQDFFIDLLENLRVIRFNLEKFNYPTFFNNKISTLTQKIYGRPYFGKQEPYNSHIMHIGNLVLQNLNSHERNFINLIKDPKKHFLQLYQNAVMGKNYDLSYYLNLLFEKIELDDDEKTCIINYLRPIIENSLKEYKNNITQEFKNYFQGYRHPIAQKIYFKLDEYLVSLYEKYKAQSRFEIFQAMKQAIKIDIKEIIDQTEEKNSQLQKTPEIESRIIILVHDTINTQFQREATSIKSIAATPEVSKMNAVKA